MKQKQKSNTVTIPVSSITSQTLVNLLVALLNVTQRNNSHCLKKKKKAQKITFELLQLLQLYVLESCIMRFNFMTNIPYISFPSLLLLKGHIENGL